MRLLFLILALLVSGEAWATDFCATATACWLMTDSDYNGGTGTTIDDGSTNSNTLTFVSSYYPSWVTADLPNFGISYHALNSLAFSDSGSGTQAIPPSMSMGNSSVTITLWVNLDSTSESGAFINFGDPSSSGGYSIGVGDTTFAASTNNGNHLIGLLHGKKWIDTGDNIGTGWHFIAFNLAQFTGYQKLYLDGSEVSSNLDPPAGVPTSGYEYVGGYMVSTQNRFVDADIAEIGVFSSSLSTTDMSTIMNYGLTGSQIAPVSSSGGAILRNSIIRNSIIR